MDPYYFHGFRDCNLETLCRVLESGFILPRKDIVLSNDKGTNLYNGNAWISLCQKSLIDDTISDDINVSYNDIIYNNLCVVIDSNLEDVVGTCYIPRDFFYEDKRKQLVKDEVTTRFSTFIDEVQTNKPIPIEKILAVGYPVSRFTGIQDKIETDLEEINNWLIRAGLTVPILNSSIYDFADSSEHFKLSKIIKK